MDRRVELEGELYDFLVRDREQGKIADKRHAELMRVHQQGWKDVAEAISKGLIAIADAIRRHP